MLQDVDARHHGPATVRPEQRGEHAHRRRFAGAVRPEQAEDGAFRHVEVDAVERPDVFKVLTRPSA